MSIIQLINPNNNFSAHDDLWHIAQSDNYNYGDFKYVFDIYVGGSQLIRAKIYPNPANGKGYFNASNVVSNTMKFDWFSPNGNFISALPDSSGQILQTYTIRVGEEYDGVTYTNLSNADIQVANCTPNLLGRQTSNSTSYLNGLLNRFLTSRDRTNAVGLDEDFFIGFSAATFEHITIKVNTISTTGTTTTYTMGNTSDEAFQGRKLVQLNIGPKAINKSYGSNIITSNIAKYSVYLYYSSTIQDIITLNIDCKSKYQSINLHFLNNYGFFDTARFNLASKLSMDAERKTYEQSDYKFKIDAVSFYDYNYDVYEDYDVFKYNESKINFGSKYQWTYKLTMDFPTDTDYEWLDELIMSPQVWAEINVKPLNDNWKEYYPVSIKANNYEYSKHINNRLRAFEIEIDMNQKRKGFRR